jgi:predicted nucleotidyltransferase
MSGRFGLTESDLAILCHALRLEPAVEKALIFGSRAKGNYRHGSDVDLALMGAHLTSRQVANISEYLNEETALPYRFDVLDYNTIHEPALVAHIDRVGEIIFEETRT